MNNQNPAQSAGRWISAVILLIVIGSMAAGFADENAFGVIVPIVVTMFIFGLAGRLMKKAIKNANSAAGNTTPPVQTYEPRSENRPYTAAANDYTPPVLTSADNPELQQRAEVVFQRRNDAEPVGDQLPPGHIMCFNCGNVFRLVGRRAKCPACGAKVERG